MHAHAREYNDMCTVRAWKGKRRSRVQFAKARQRTKILRPNFVYTHIMAFTQKKLCKEVLEETRIFMHTRNRGTFRYTYRIKIARRFESKLAF